MLPGGPSQLQGHIQPPARPDSEGKPDASPGAGRSLKTLWGRSDKATGERMCLHQRKSPDPSSTQQRGRAAAGHNAENRLLARSRHTAAVCQMLPTPSTRPCRGAGGTGVLGILMPGCRRGLQGLCQPLPQPPPLCPQPRPCFIFFASSCPGFGGPLAPCGTSPGLAQPGRSQTGPNRHLHRHVAQTPSCSLSSAARAPASTQQRWLCVLQHMEWAAATSARVPCSRQAPGRATHQPSRSLCTGELEGRGLMAFYTNRCEWRSLLSCHPDSRGCQPAGQAPGPGRGEEQRKHEQQAVTFSQKATRVQSRQGLSFIRHHTALTGAPLWVLLLQSTYFQHAQQVCSLRDV